MRTVRAKTLRGGPSNQALSKVEAKKSPEKHPGGRPSYLTPATFELICDAIRVGTPFEAAVGVAGIRVRTARYWMALAEEPENPAHRPEHVEFRDAVEKATAQHVAAHAATMYRVGNGVDQNGNPLTKKFAGSVEMLKFIAERGPGRRYWGAPAQVVAPTAPIVGVTIYENGRRPTIDATTRGVFLPAEDE